MRGAFVIPIMPHDPTFEKLAHMAIDWWDSPLGVSVLQDSVGRPYYCPMRVALFDTLCADKSTLDVEGVIEAGSSQDEDESYIQRIHKDYADVV